MKRNPTRVVVVAGAATLIAIGLAACGGSSSPSSTPAAAAAQSATGSSGPAGAGSTGATGATITARRSALAACLKKNGVTLPTRRFGATGRFGGTGATGRFGVTGRSGATGASGGRARGFFGGGGAFAGNPKFAAAFAKCGGSAGRFGAGGAPRSPGFVASSPQDRVEVASYVACMKQRGISLPTPNFSGSGSVFGATVNTTTAAFRSANANCQGLLKFLTPASPSGATGAAGA
jgi:collagen type I/II/III/V/XI/XXIV/XXVII alpha